MAVKKLLPPLWHKKELMHQKSLAEFAACSRLRGFCRKNPKKLSTVERPPPPERRGTGKDGSILRGKVHVGIAGELVENGQLALLHSVVQHLHIRLHVILAHQGAAGHVHLVILQNSTGGGDPGAQGAVAVGGEHLQQGVPGAAVAAGHEIQHFPLFY